MITINSTESERYELLCKSKITVIPWKKELELKIVNPNETISHALRRYADECNLIGTEIRMDGVPELIRISKKTVNESIAAMRRQRADLLDLGKMFTVLEQVLKNAVLMEVEPFRYDTMHKAQLVIGEYQYISAFYDGSVLYPVKITVERCKRKNDTNVHVVITVGKIKLSDISNIIKRSAAYTGVHSSGVDNESLLSEGASFDINIQQLAKLFNTEDGVIFKNLPDAMLSSEQSRIKSIILESDAEKVREKQRLSMEKDNRKKK